MTQFADRFREVFGFATLHVGRIREVSGLDVVDDAEQAHHALIQGLPHRESDPALAERIGSQLARQARLLAME